MYIIFSGDLTIILDTEIIALLFFIAVGARTVTNLTPIDFAGYAGESDLQAAQIVMIGDCINDSIVPYLKVYTAETEKEKVRFCLRHQLDA